MGKVGRFSSPLTKQEFFTSFTIHMRYAVIHFASVVGLFHNPDDSHESYSPETVGISSVVEEIQKNCDDIEIYPKEDSFCWILYVRDAKLSEWDNKIINR